MSFKEDYLRGLDSIYDYAPYFYRIMRFIGIPSANSEIPTAQVSYDPHSKNILFEINPALIEDMTDEEIGFVVSHEAYHVILKHLFEIQDRQEYPDQESLIMAQEAIINDTVQGTLGLDAPDMELVFGENFGADFSGFSTREGYDWITQNLENDKNGDSGEDSDSKNNSDSSSNDSKNNDSGDKNSDTDSSSSSSNNGSNDDSAANESGSDSDSESNDENNESETGQPRHGSCGGVVVPEGFGQDFIDTIADSMKNAVDEINKNGETIPSYIIDAFDELAEDSGVDVTKSYGIGNNDRSMFVGQTDDMNLDWKMLISEFNPKILTSGGTKYRDSWASVNRRMTSVYPKVILPNRIRKNNSGDNGDSVPTFILALDMSYSIPERLINGLANLADTIPDKFVKVMPVTWSDYVVEFDTKVKNIVRRSGTNIDGVWDYSQRVKKKIGKEPYVFVITDGECSFNDYYYSRNRESAVNDSAVQNNWYWGAIDSSSVSTIKSRMRRQVDPNKVYRVDEFLV